MHAQNEEGQICQYYTVVASHDTLSKYK